MRHLFIAAIGVASALTLGTAVAPAVAAEPAATISFQGIPSTFELPVHGEGAINLTVQISGVDASQYALTTATLSQGPGRDPLLTNFLGGMKVQFLDGGGVYGSSVAGLQTLTFQARNQTTGVYTSTISTKVTLVANDTTPVNLGTSNRSYRKGTTFVIYAATSRAGIGLKPTLYFAKAHSKAFRKIATGVVRAGNKYSDWGQIKFSTKKLLAGGRVYISMPASSKSHASKSKIYAFNSGNVAKAFT